MKKDCFDQEVIAKLWKKFSTVKEIPKLERRGAIMILSMLAKSDPSIIATQLATLIKIGFHDQLSADPVLARLSCIALQRLQTVQLLPSDHIVFEKLIEVIVDLSCDDWFSIAEQAINTIYMLAEHPDVVSTRMLVTLLKKCDLIEKLQESSCSIKSSDLSRLIFVGGHVAIKQIVYLEIMEQGLSRKKNNKSLQTDPKSSRSYDDMDQIVGTVEDEIGENMQSIREQELMYGKDSILPIVGSLTVYICTHSLMYSDLYLRAVAALSLAKFMCVSFEFCEKHLQLLVTLLERSSDPTIKSNIVISLGDIAISFNNLMDQNISYLYKRLQDRSLTVKKNALMVLTHLILNGMVKVKGQLSEMAKCLTDEDERIRDLAKLFFSELAGKDQAIYNNLPDIISNLSQDGNSVSEADFHAIMTHLFSYIKKDRQNENLVEKLCHRFPLSSNERHWRDIAYCLSFLQYTSERMIKKLADALPYYQDKLGELNVHESFMTIINKAKKFQKPEMKLFLDEFEKKIESIHKELSNETTMEESEMHEDTITKIEPITPSRSRGTSHYPTRSKDSKLGVSEFLSSIDLVSYKRLENIVTTITFCFITS
jgi:condensin complex subunit 1